MKSVLFVDCGAIAMAVTVMVRCLDGEGDGAAGGGLPDSCVAHAGKEEKSENRSENK